MTKVLVAMSGGVDSAVSALLIKKGGYYTEGITMKLWNEGTADSKDSSDAKRSADSIGIPHTSIDLSECFKELVVNDFTNQYINGHTPNPCVTCNRCIKFGRLMEICKELGFDKLATGHYARIEQDESGEFLLKKAKDASKDQSYFLWSIKKEYLSSIILPLGKLSKDEVRSIAENEGLEVAHRGDSQDICFVPSGDYADFIKRYTGETFKRGSFLSTDGTPIGMHDGMINFTIGQRKGLGIALGYPAFVQKKDAKSNTVTLCKESELYSNELTAHSLNLLRNGALTDKERLEVKIRYRHTPVHATVERIGDQNVRVVFDIPQRAVTSGQSVVFYDGDVVVGGAVIE